MFWNRRLTPASLLLLDAATLTQVSEATTAARIDGLRRDAGAAGGTDAAEQGIDAADGGVHVVAAGTPGRTEAASHGVLTAQRVESERAQAQELQIADRVADLDGHQHGQPVPAGLRVKISPQLWLYIVGAVLVLAAETYVLLGPFNTLFATGTGTGSVAGSLMLSGITSGLAGLFGHARGKTSAALEVMSPVESAGRDRLQRKALAYAVGLVVVSIMAFVARVYDAGYDVGYWTMTTLAYLLFQLFFLIVSLQLPTAMHRMHAEAVSVGVKAALPAAKSELTRAQTIAKDVQLSHCEQLARLNADRREVTLTYIRSLQAATHGAPGMRDRLRDLMPLVRDDGTLPPYTGGGEPRPTSRPRRQPTRPTAAPPRPPTPTTMGTTGFPGYTGPEEMLRDILGGL